MPARRNDIDPDGLLEYSVVYTDRSLNHMSAVFGAVMRDLSNDLRSIYNAQAAVIIPGSGTYAMEAVVSQLAQGQRCLVIRNGWFSYRWTQIFEQSTLGAEVSVLSAQPQEASSGPQPFAPVSIQEAVKAIHTQRPALVFAPHVETSSGIMLPDDYIRTLAQATHEVGGLLVIDCIASGCIWLDMRALGIDILISAPQKGWSSTPCAGLVMLSEAALTRVQETTSVSFSLDLKKWLSIMQAYEQGGFAYHATMPTDSLRQFRDTINELRAFGVDRARQAQQELGQQVRGLLAQRGFVSVAAEGFEAPGVVVCYTSEDEMQNGKAFVREGVQIAAGVPLQVGEPVGFKTFRVGLFGLDKLQDVPQTVSLFEQALDKVMQDNARK